MFHVKRFFILFSVLFQFNARAQSVLTLRDKPFVYNKPIDSLIWKQLERDKQFQLLSHAEKMVFYWTNNFRQDPKRFFDNVVKEFVVQFPEANTIEFRSLERDVKKVSGSLPFLQPDKGLLEMSREHSSDLVKRGSIISHQSSKGKNFVQRINETGFYRCGAENIYVGANDPLEALIALLIDYGVPDKGHRTNLLDPRFGRMGVSFPSTSSKRGLLVQEFACP